MSTDDDGDAVVWQRYRLVPDLEEYWPPEDDDMPDAIAVGLRAVVESAEKLRQQWENLADERLYVQVPDFLKPYVTPEFLQVHNLALGKMQPIDDD